MTNIQKFINLKGELPLDAAGKRLDQALADLFPEHSRSRLKIWIDAGKVKVNGEIKRPKDKVEGGESVEIQAEMEERVGNWEAEDLLVNKLNVVYEDDSILVLNKPAGLVVHPGSGNYSGTLVNALLHYCPDLKQISRAGIVHRLDKDTTGLMVVAKTVQAQVNLAEQLQNRVMKRTYEAVVYGRMTAGGTVDAPLARDPHDRLKRSVLEYGKPAVTHYRVIERFPAHTHIRVILETGRTHQIRAHMAHIGYPIVGDKLYGGRLRIPPKADAVLLDTLRHFPRQALHAKSLGLQHPVSGEWQEWESELPEEMQVLLRVLGGGGRGGEG